MPKPIEMAGAGQAVALRWVPRREGAARVPPDG